MKQQEQKYKNSNFDKYVKDYIPLFLWVPNYL